MKETPVFIPHLDERLFGMLHEPEASTARTPFVFCHPFAEEKLWTQRVYVSFARQLAREGHAVLRFDLRGNGDSGGTFSESSLTGAKADVRRAIDYVRQATGSRRVNLLGLRLGATIASLVAEETPDVDQLILWAPIVDGARYMQDLLRVNLTTQMAVYKEIRQDRVALVEAMREGAAVNVDGYDLTLPMYEEVSAVSLAADRKQYDGPCLIVQIEPRPRPQPADLQQLAASYSHATLAFVQEEPFWKEIPRFYFEASNLFSSTADWQQRAAGGPQ